MTPFRFKAAPVGVSRRIAARGLLLSALVGGLYACDQQSQSEPANPELAGGVQDASVEPTAVAAQAEQAVRFIKVAKDGRPLAADAVSFACVEDLASGLIWEVKQAGLPADNAESPAATFRWGGEGSAPIGSDIRYDDWNALITPLREQKRCGKSNWRVPNIDELKGLVDNTAAGVKIDVAFFPQAQAGVYWAADAYEHYPEHAQNVDFTSGQAFYYNGFRGEPRFVRLVSDDK